MNKIYFALIMYVMKFGSMRRIIILTPVYNQDRTEKNYNKKFTDLEEIYMGIDYFNFINTFHLSYYGLLHCQKFQTFLFLESRPECLRVTWFNKLQDLFETIYLKKAKSLLNVLKIQEGDSKKTFVDLTENLKKYLNEKYAKKECLEYHQIVDLVKRVINFMSKNITQIYWEKLKAIEDYKLIKEQLYFATTKHYLEYYKQEDNFENSTIISLDFDGEVLKSNGNNQYTCNLDIKDCDYELNLNKIFLDLNIFIAI